MVHTQRPISYNQERLILSEALTDANYGLPQSFIIKGDLNVPILQKSVEFIVNRYESLRTHFGKNEDGNTFQIIRDTMDGYFEYLEWPEENEAELKAHLTARLSAPFDLFNGPLFKSFLVRLKKDTFIFAFNTHHAISDGVSIGIITKEISACYNRLLKNEAVKQTPLKETYPHFIQKQKSEIDYTIHSLESFWKAYLQNAETNLNLPTDFTPSSTPYFKKKCVEKLLSKALFNRVKAKSKETKVSLFTFFFSVFSQLLSRYSHQTDISIAFQSAGRQTYPETYDLVGLFSNVLVLRTTLSETMPFSEYLQKSRQNIKKALQHQNFPYHLIVQKFKNAPRIGINWYPQYETLNLDGMDIEKKSFVQWESDFDFNLYCEYEKDSILLKLLYNPHLYQPETLNHFLSQFEWLMTQAVEQTEKNSFDYSLVDETWKKKCPDLSHPLPNPDKMIIVRAFLEQAKNNPTENAIVSNKATWQYQALDSISNRLAHYLAKQGVGKGDVVAILTHRDPVMIYAMLGILKAGAAFLVADASYPEKRLMEYFEISKPKCFLISDAVELSSDMQATFFQSDRTHSFLLPNTPKSAKKALKNYSEALPDVRIDPDDMAYIIFTSGSTGKPKCIVTPHFPLPHFIQWHINTFGMTANDHFSMLSGLSHDPVLRDIFTPLSLGACLYIPDQETIFDPSYLMAWLKKKKIGISHLTPAMGEIIITGYESTPVPLEHLKYLFWGGDILYINTVDRFNEIAPQAAHINFYGATETPQVMGYFEVDKKDGLNKVPVGKGISDVQLLVLRKNGALCGANESGEIHIRSKYLSNGYFGNKKETERRFKKNPHTGEDLGDVIYRTGDLGRYQTNGEIMLLGRADNQVKIRGFRVELDEIAATITRNESIREAIVLSKKVRIESSQLVAYYRFEQNKTVAQDQLLFMLKQSLPAYMIPSYFIEMDHLPLLPNGKVDKNALPEPTSDDIPKSGAFKEATSKEEKELVNVWKEVLNIDKIGVSDNFFELGGDSLTALKIIYKMKKLGIDERLCRGILQGKTIEQIIQSNHQIANGSISSLTSNEPLSHTEKTNLLINTIRGILVFLIVLAHWSTGILQKLPPIFMSTKELLPLLFNIATPGFSIVYGISLGYIYYPIYQKEPQRAKRMLHFGALILFVGILFRSISRVSMHILEVGPLSSTDFFNTFFSVLLYYFIAVLTATVWFKLIGYQKKEIRNCIVLMATSYLTYRLLLITLGDKEFTGFVQLVKLMLVAKFNYFNMSVGAIGGMALGFHIKTCKRQENLTKKYAQLGFGLMSIGFLISFKNIHSSGWFTPSVQVLLWKWMFYGGLIVASIALINLKLARYDKKSRYFQQAFRLTGVLGLCALPIFILQGLILDIKNIFDIFHIPEMISFALVLSLFFGSCYIMMRKLYNLYYGTMLS